MKEPPSTLVYGNELPMIKRREILEVVFTGPDKKRDPQLFLSIEDGMLTIVKTQSNPYFRQETERIILPEYHVRNIMSFMDEIKR